MRVILYTGKGGVGKTSIAAATAVCIAQLGKKTIIMSTDPAHSLADSLEKDIGPEPKQVAENLFAQEIDVLQETKKNWGKVQNFLAVFLLKKGLDRAVAEEFAIFPGMEDLFSLLKLKDYYEKKLFEVAIIDCAPTATTIRMLSFPDMMGWYMEKMFNIERKVVKVLRPLAQKVMDVPIPSDDVYQSCEDLYRRMEGIKDILTDPKTSSIRLVFNPENMVIRESRRAYTYLNLFGYSVDSVIANKIFPLGLKDGYFDEWKKIQEFYLKEASDSFSPLPIFKARLYDREIMGMERLSQMAGEIFLDKDPSQVFYHERPLQIIQEGDDLVLEIKVPFVDKKDLDMWTKGDELIVRAGSFKRNLILPMALSSRMLKEAFFQRDKLRIIFGGEKE